MLFVNRLLDNVTVAINKTDLLYILQQNVNYIILNMQCKAKNVIYVNSFRRAVTVSVNCDF